MDFSDTSHIYQLFFALTGGLLLFVIAYSLPEKVTVSLLVVSLPFQPIDSAFGSITTVLIYMVALIWLLRGRFKKLPLVFFVLGILFAYSVSLTQAPRQTYADHMFYMIGLLSNFLLFYIVYNLFRKPDVSAEFGMKLFTACGLVVLVFSVLKLLLGFDQLIVLGIEELTVQANLEDKKRLVGPFNAVGVNGAFYGLQILLSVYFLMHTKRFWWVAVLLVMILGNAGLLIATGSRGSFVSTVFGLLLFMFFFVRRIGLGRTLFIGASSVALFSIAAIVVTNYTEFNVLFERLANTKFYGIVPDSRHGAFGPVFERIQENPIVGHGPRLRLMNEELRLIPGYEPIFFPHNLYLHILFTVGLLGFTAFAAFFLVLGMRYLIPIRKRHEDPILEDMPRLATVVLCVFLIDELKIEFLRFMLFDYQSYMFALWGMFLAYCDRLRSEPAMMPAYTRPATMVPGRAAAKA